VRQSQAKSLFKSQPPSNRQKEGVLGVFNQMMDSDKQSKQGTQNLENL
jgi:hypothetical protein